MEKIKTTIIFSKDFEFQRLLATKQKIEWFIANKYNVNRFTLPKTINVEKLRTASDAEIMAGVETDYSPETYDSHVRTLNDLLPGYLDKLIQFLPVLNLKPLSNIDIMLTKYGVGGSYVVPNKIIVNISNHYSIGLVRTVLHEIIHLHIQYLVDKYKLGQWQKEVLVDCIFEKFLPELLKRQPYPVDVSDIQKIFAEYYPNLELIAEQVSNLKK